MIFPGSRTLRMAANAVRVCRVCHCTDDDACLGGCAWFDVDLCTTCAEMIQFVGDYMHTAGPHTRNLTTAIAAVARLAAAVEWDPDQAAGDDEPLIVVPGR